MLQYSSLSGANLTVFFYLAGLAYTVYRPLTAVVGSRQQTCVHPQISRLVNLILALILAYQA